MQISLTGHHVDITSALRDYVDGKLAKIEKHFDHIGNVHVVLAVEKLVQKAEATLHVSGADLFAEATNENMYAAIDALVDKLDRQILKYKEKQQSHHRGYNSNKGQ